MKLSRDLWAGILLFSLGLIVAIYVYANYRMGTLRSMGPGYMPFALAVVLSALGVIAAIMSQVLPPQDYSGRELDWRKVVPVALGVLIFALTVTKLGLIISTILLVVISSIADRRFNFKHSFFLAISLCLISWVVFVLLLKMTIPVFW
ncbi:tripartite tricarboxylate transporter TctB family protein [Oceanospirillum sanctuarii]|uniref:tripartite tricarboxylate transporter TctB family protein n=1 Tax=Oceanospirillum sanctuarii TaxID=1434821 RepID=UPI000A3CEF35|nr:tripartite tricarboxylate transporter TctB family protein [Oceanospirillum sanctuarii]